MSEISPLSPEARAHLPATTHADESEATWFARLSLPGQVVEVAKRVGMGRPCWLLAMFAADCRVA